MIKRIRIPFKGDYFIQVTRNNPDNHERVSIQEHISANRTSFNEQELKENLDRVNMWIGNCDQKAGLILATLGVGVTILFTSDFVKFIRNELVIPFKTYLHELIGVLDWHRLLIALTLIYVAIGVLMCFYHLLNSILAKTDLNTFPQAGLEKSSMLHFESVADKTYQDFCESEVNLLNDLRSQVYVNSVICTAKFKHYNKAIKALFGTIPAVVFLLLLVIFL